ncbi:MAG: ComEA family DNA-binding protein [Candidatus Omnitrophota bacterium]
MLNLTKNEASVLAVFAAVLCFGSAFHVIIKKYPRLINFTDRLETGYVPHKIDINTADKEELKSVPYIGDYTAAAILEYRQTHGHFETLDQLKRIRGIRENNFKRFSPFLKAGVR